MGLLRSLVFLCFMCQKVIFFCFYCIIGDFINFLLAATGFEIGGRSLTWVLEKLFLNGQVYTYSSRKTENNTGRKWSFLCLRICIQKLWWTQRNQVYVLSSVSPPNSFQIHWDIIDQWQPIVMQSFPFAFSFHWLFL